MTWIIVALTIGMILGAVVAIASIVILPHPVFILIALIGFGCLGSCGYFLLQIARSEREEEDVANP